MTWVSAGPDFGPSSQIDVRATLILAFADVRPGREARLMILEEGGEWSRLEALAGELRPGSGRGASRLPESALFVLSSAWEGLPTVLIEPREIFQEGRLGGPVPVGDPVALTDAMIDALERPRGALPFDALTPFTRDAAVEHYLRLIESA